MDISFSLKWTKWESIGKSFQKNNLWIRKWWTRMGDEGKQWKVYDRTEWWILERFTQSYNWWKWITWRKFTWNWRNLNKRDWSYDLCTSNIGWNSSWYSQAADGTQGNCFFGLENSQKWFWGLCYDTFDRLQIL